MFRINHLQTDRRGQPSRPETYDLKKCATFVPSIMLIPKPVEVYFAISPKTGQRKTWLPRLLPEKVDAAKPGPKKVKAAVEKVESAIKKVKAAGQKSGSRKPKK